MKDNDVMENAEAQDREDTACETPEEIRENKSGELFSKILSFVLWLLAGAFCGFAYGMNAGSFTLPGLFLFLLVFILAILLHTMIHEAGHLVCGLISGYRFSSYRVGPVMIKKLDGKLRLKRHSVSGTGGQCLMLPPEPYSENIPVTLYNLGGILANLIFAALFLALYFLAGQKTFFGAFALSFAVLGLVFALQNGIPFGGYVANDGKNLFSLSKDPSAKRGLWIQLQVLRMLDDGVRLKDMPAEWFVMPKPGELGSGISAAVGVFSCNRDMDGLNFKAAAESGLYLLTRATGLLGLHRSYITGDLIFCELVGENRREEIERLYTKKIKKYLSAPQLSSLRTLYAYDLLYNRDEAAADERLGQFEKLAGRYPYPCEVEGERELLDIARQRYENRKSTEKTDEENAEEAAEALPEQENNN